MSIRLDSVPLRVQFADDTPITIEAYSPYGGIPSRMLRIGGKRVMDMGNTCNTCDLLFSHFANPPKRVVIERLAERLRQGIAPTPGHWSAHWAKAITEVFPLLPRGAYEINLLQLTPRLVRPGTPDDYFVSEQLPLWSGYVSATPNDPKTTYYRTMTQVIGQQQLFELVVPLFDETSLNPATVDGYRHAIRGGARPTAVSLTLLDWRQPANWQGDPVVTQHFSLNHYLLDGHHKVYAASQEQAPLTLLSFLSRDDSLATFDDVATVFGLLKA